MELLGFRRCLERLLQAGVVVDTITTDRSPSIRKLMRETYSDIQHQFDPWHVATGKLSTNCNLTMLKHPPPPPLSSLPSLWFYYLGLKKKLTAAAKNKKNNDLLPWIKAINNHFWWCCQSCGGDAEVNWWDVFILFCTKQKALFVLLP